jgi:hypothetical protein
VLTFDVKKISNWTSGVVFIIDSLPSDQWLEVKKNILDFRDKDVDAILQEPEQKGRIYVGGLYVTTNKNFHCGYAFQPGTISLNRDRNMVGDFDLSWETSRLWTRRGGSKCNELLEANAPDVAHVDSHAVISSPVVGSYVSHFSSRYGSNAYPVSTQAEIEKATRAGFKWVLVPQTVQNLLRKVKSYFIPDVDSPAVKLKNWRKTWDANLRLYLPQACVKDLDAIIEEMQPEVSEAVEDPGVPF